MSYAWPGEMPPNPAGAPPSAAAGAATDAYQQATMYGGVQMPQMLPPTMQVPTGPAGPQSTSQLPPQAAQTAYSAASAGPAAPSAPQGSAADAICNVWKRNLPYHMALLRHYIPVYNYVTVDVKFPGIVARPIGTFHSTAEFHYQTLRANVDLVHPVQLGLTLTDAAGNVPPGGGHYGTWQFNFKWDPETEMCSAESVDMLRQSGVDLARHQTEGIELEEFFDLLTTSGLVLNPNITWITFYSGYDLGLLVTQLINHAVPNEKADYLTLVQQFFPQIWDVKLLVKAFGLSSKNFLHEVAEEFQLYRGSALSPAGSDSRLTALCFYEILRSLGDHATGVKNRLFGLEEGGLGTEDEATMHAAQVQAQAQAQAVAQAHAHAQAAAQAQAQAAAQGVPPGVPPGAAPGMGPGATGVPQMVQMPPYVYGMNGPAGGRRPPVYFQR